MASRTLTAKKARTFDVRRLTEKAATSKGPKVSTKKVPVKELAVAMRQLATMISSGLTLVRALGVLAEQTSHEELARIFREVRDEVERGRSLTEALSRHPKAVGRLGIAMVRAGEAGGVLDVTLGRLAETLEKEAELRRKVKSAMTYPVAIGGLAMMIVAGMLLFVVPMFKDLFDQISNGAPLPLPTRMLLAVADVFTRFFPFFMIGFIAAGIAFKRWRDTPSGRRKIDGTLLKLPLFGQLFAKTAQARFARTLASMLHAGVPVLQALDITRETVGNTVIGDGVDKVSAAVREGSAIAPPMESAGVFPPMLVQMVAVGEETGSVDELCEKVATHLSNEVDAMVSALTSLIEPLLIAFLGLVIGGMVTALYLPMFKLVELVQ